MAAAYNLEPAPTAKVLLTTTSGDILLELFAKQTPLSSRNFLQHCLDGYYTNNVFHRLVPGFIIQGGDPTGTGEGGESIYTSNPSGTFADEFHSRLKFNRRGLLGMANGGRRDDNGSQFFITLAGTEELDGRNTMFGRVVGDTIFNVVKMAEADLTEGTERPLYPTKVLGAEVLVNPFEDMVIRERKQVVDGGRKEAGGKRKGKRKVGKTLLSFGGEEGDDGGVEEPVAVKKAKFNSKFVTAAPEGPPDNTPTPPPPLPKTKPASPPPAPLSQPKNPPTSPPPKPPGPRSPPPPTLLSQTLTSIATLTTSLKRPTPTPQKDPKPRPRPASTLLLPPLPATSTRARKRNTARSGVTQKADLQQFAAFRRRLEAAGADAQAASARPSDGSSTSPAAPPPGAAAGEEEPLCDLHFLADCRSCGAGPEAAALPANDDDNDTAWLAHQLTFAKERRGRETEWARSGEGLDVEDPWGGGTGRTGKERAWDGKNGGSAGGAGGPAGGGGRRR
ncbi:MAG: Peptidyl-prolyl isomerase cwc27 [Geoglossum umbratile]|nr:MAG: Peptidyl-prolyl isomerase cwc27 [Geoglossum umbratile]